MNLDNEMCQFQIRQEDEMERNNVNDREMGDYHKKTSKVVEDIPFVSLLRAKYLFLVDRWYTVSTKQSSGVIYRCLLLWNIPTNIKLLKQCIKQLVNDKIMEFVSRNFKLLFLCLEVCEYMHCIREICFFFFENVNRCKMFSWQHTGVKFKKSQVKQRNLT